MKKPTYIIAEAGVNHNGSLILAKKLIDVAADAGVDAVKFQTFITENVVTKRAEKASYQKDNTGNDESQFEMIKKLELNENDHVELVQYCEERKIQFCSTAFDLESVELLKKLKMPFWKIPSGEITNFPYLKKIGSFNEKIVISTGMSSLGEIEDALNVLINAGTKREKISILHCNTEYPTPIADVNLNAMKTIGDAFMLNYGYSDHTLGIEVPIAAVALGATIIEKHFTLDKCLEGPDHIASLEPKELKAMVEAIRNVDLCFGTGIKSPSASEIKNRIIARKSIVARCDIKKGDIFSEDNLTVMRPGTGISPMRWHDVLGTISARDYKKEDII